MQQACYARSTPTPLPSINDPSLDAVQSCRAPEPSHEEIMVALESETQCVPVPIDPTTFTDPDAIAMAAAGPEWYARAKRVDECGQLARIRSHSSGHCKHLRLEIGYCDCRFSPCCRQRKADEIIKRWTPAIDHVMNHHRGSKYVLLELRIPALRSGDLAGKFITKVCNDIKIWIKYVSEQNIARKEAGANTQCFHGEQDPYWVNCSGFLGNDLVIRVLISDADSLGVSRITTDAWKSLWPRWKVSVTVGKHLAFRSAFSQLVHPLPLKESKDWTEQEIMFNRMQLFRAHNASLTCPGGELAKVIPVIEMAESEAQAQIASEPSQELCVEHTTDNSVTPPNPQHPKGKPGVPCPQCGGVLDKLSGSMRVGSNQLREEMVNIRGLTHIFQPPG